MLLTWHLGSYVVLLVSMSVRPLEISLLKSKICVILFGFRLWCSLLKMVVLGTNFEMVCYVSLLGITFVPLFQILLVVQFKLF